MSLSTPAQVMQRLEEIDQHLATFHNEWVETAKAYFAGKRDVEEMLAVAREEQEGPELARKDKALKAVRQTPEYVRFKQAEGAFNGGRDVMRLLETRANIGMALLKSEANLAKGQP